MIWKDLPFTVLKTVFLSVEEITVAIRKEDISWFKKSGFEPLQYEGDYETEPPYRFIRYMKPTRELSRELFRIIEKGDVVKVKHNADGQLFDNGLKKYYSHLAREVEKTDLMNKLIKHLSEKDKGRREQVEIRKMRKVRAIELRAFGFKVKEIAKILKITTGSIYSYFR